MAYYQQPAYNPGYNPAPYNQRPASPVYPGQHKDAFGQAPSAPYRYGGQPFHGHAPMYPDVEAGGYGKPYTPAPRPFEATSTHSNLRNAFLRKIYATLCLQFALTTLICGICAYHRPAQLTILSNPQLYLYGSMIPGFIVLLALSCMQRAYPINAILLFGFTVLESITLGVLCTLYRAVGLGDIVVTAAGITAAIFITLTVYVHATKTDFSFLGGFLMAGMLILFVWGLLNLFLGWHATFFYSALGALLSVGLILFDTSNILLKYGYDDHIAACITLYLDVVNLFIYLLQILASSRREDR